MALDPKIASLKAAGAYRFEFDKSQVVSIPANQTRLIVGFSKKGPFNTPVFVPDSSFFKELDIKTIKLRIITVNKFFIIV